MVVNTMKNPKTILCPSCGEEIEVQEIIDFLEASHDCGPTHQMRVVWSTPRSNPIFPTSAKPEDEEK
jgi:hypothetical protein